VHNNIIQKDRFSTGKNAAINRVVAPVLSASKKATVQSGNVPPYILLFEKNICRKQSRDLRFMEQEWSKSQ